MRLSPHLSVMIGAAQKAARYLVRDFTEVENLQVSVKGPSDFVSEADNRTQEILREELMKARPGYAFLMEEGPEITPQNWAWRFIIDPIDGTTNFLHGIPHFAISIGLEKKISEDETEIVGAVIFNPITNELFHAEKGSGAFLNNHRLRVSGRKNFSEALFATGIPFAAVSPLRQEIFSRILADLMPQVAGIRRFGAASLDLAWLAAGRYDGYWELGLKPWDVAAGFLLVKEAGGYVSNPEGKRGFTTDIVAGNPHLHEKLREFVAKHLADAKLTFTK